MANPVRAVDYQLLRLYIDNIPRFDGNPAVLGIFIEDCQNLINNFADANNDNLNAFLHRAIIGRLTGRAQSLIGSRTEIRTWDGMKNLLNSSFSDQRDIDCLEQDLLSLRPNKNESPYNFGVRLQDARNLIVIRLNSLGLTAETRAIKTQHYDGLALRTFIRGLTGQLQNNIRFRRPASLEQAMAFVVEEENFYHSLNVSNSLNQHQSYKTLPRMQPINYQKPKPQNTPFQRPIIPNPAQFYYPKPMFTPQNFFQPQNYSRQPNFIKPFNNYVPKPLNWKPNNNFPTQKHPSFMQRPNLQNRPQASSNRTYKPEPMETSTIRSRIPNKPNFSVQELFSHEIDNDAPENVNHVYPNSQVELANNDHVSNLAPENHDYSNLQFEQPNMYPECYFGNQSNYYPENNVYYDNAMSIPAYYYTNEALIENPESIDAQSFHEAYNSSNDDNVNFPATASAANWTT